MLATEYKNGLVSRLHSGVRLTTFNPAHLLEMTDDTGMLQHCRYSIPDRRHGYTLDDNIRALLVATQSNDPLLIKQLPVLFKLCDVLSATRRFVY